jgi:hypothetical protein
MSNLIDRLRARYDSAEGSDLDCAAINEIDRLRGLVTEMRNSNGELRFHLGRLERELAEARGLLIEAIRHVANSYDGKESLRRIQAFL